jgi:hypothetical protein
VRAYNFDNFAPPLRASQTKDGFAILTPGESTVPQVDGNAALPAEWAKRGVVQYQWYRAVPMQPDDEAEPEFDAPAVESVPAFMAGLDAAQDVQYQYEAISGATQANYVPTPEDVGSFIVAEITVNDDRFSGTKMSAVARVDAVPETPTVEQPPVDKSPNPDDVSLDMNAELADMATTGASESGPLLVILLLLFLAVSGYATSAGMYRRRDVEA